jgi:D-alanine transaminase
VAVVTLEDIRWQRCDIKAITLLANVLLRQQAAEQGAAEAILVRDGKVIEGSSSNIFVIIDDTLLTPPKSAQMLPGITRDLVLELADRHGVHHRETDITPAMLEQAGEIWITSSTREIVPVTRLDNRKVGNGNPGPMWKTMSAHYRDYKAAVRAGEAS